MSKKILRNSLHPQAWLIWRLGQQNKKNGLLDRTEAESRKYRHEFVRRVVGTYKPENVVNRIHAPAGRSASLESATNIVSSFFNLETHKLSMLVPEIMLFRVDEGKYTPFYFPIVSDFDPLENPTESVPGYAGGNAVIQSFNVNLMGSDPFTARKYLESNLTIQVDSLANIFINHAGYARLADLFTISVPGSKAHTNTGQTIKAGQLSRPIEVAAILRYSLRDPDGIFTYEEKREIEKNTMSLRMNVKDHAIDVQKDGTASIKISYSARISTFDDNRHSYSFTSTSDDVILEADIKSINLEDIEDITKSDEEREKKTELEKQQALTDTMTSRALQLQQITENLEKMGRFFEEHTTEASLAKYYKPQKSGNSEDAQKSEDKSKAGNSSAPAATPSPSSPTEKKKKQAQQKLKKLLSQNRTFHYVLFGDMLEQYCRHLRDLQIEAIAKIKKADTVDSRKAEKLKIVEENKQKLKKIKILLPDIKLVFPKGRPRVINMADIPISTDLYQKFIYNQILNTKGQTYSINDLLSNCVNKLLPSAIGGYSHKAPYVLKNTKQVFASTTFAGKAVRPSLGSSGIDVDAIEGPSHASFTDPNDENEYFLIYPEPDAETPSTSAGSESLDYKNNIYHFHLGKDRGIIKNISFQKFTVPFRQEALMTNQIGLYDELKMPYSANITMFGNMLFYPGSQVYIDPFSLGFGDPRDKNSPAADLGLGGYYMVLAVDTSYSNSGMFETRLKCSFASWPSNRPGAPEFSSDEERPVDSTYDGAAESSDQEETGDAPGYGTDDADPYMGLSLQSEDIQRFRDAMGEVEVVERPEEDTDGRNTAWHGGREGTDTTSLFNFGKKLRRRLIREVEERRREDSE